MRAVDVLSSQVVDYKTNIIRERMKDYYRTLKQGQVNLPEWLDPDFRSIEKDIERLKQNGNSFHSLFKEYLSNEI